MVSLCQIAAKASGKPQTFLVTFVLTLLIYLVIIHFTSTSTAALKL